MTEGEKIKRREYYKRWKEANPLYFLNYQRTHRPEIRATNRRQYQVHKEKRNAKSVAWTKANPEKAAAFVTRWQKNNPEKLRENYKRWYRENPNLVRERNEQWRNENRERYRMTHRIWHEKQRECNPLYRAQMIMRSVVSRTKRVMWSRRTEKLIGCDRAWFMAWMEVQFKPGMGWLNHGEWHIDHIRPVSSFDLRNADELRKVNHWTNLQPLWSSENLSKGRKVL